MNFDKHLFNKKELGKYRTTLRKNLTSAEASLWTLLKARQVSGCKFRRQHSIGNFIVDFCCPKKMLIIEPDGNIHGENQQILKDELRDNYLKELGFTVLRFENKLVFQDPKFFINEIEKCLFKKK
jgi:very-short-patch-repair endonuclease